MHPFSLFSYFYNTYRCVLFDINCSIYLSVTAIQKIGPSLVCAVTDRVLFLFMFTKRMRK